MSPEYAREWIRKAEADRKAAVRALTDSRRSKDQAEIACFHAQQCAEKYLKAALACGNKPIPRIHDLLALAHLLRRFHFPTVTLRKDLQLLNQYGVEIRYPGSSATILEARKAVAAMKRIIRRTEPVLLRLRAPRGKCRQHLLQHPAKAGPGSV